MGRREIIDREHIRTQYDDAERVRIRYDTHERYSENRGAFREFVLEQVQARAGMRLLDVGCGPGPFHPALVAARVEVVAMDQSAGMLREVLAQALDIGGPTRVVRADAERLPLTDARFDRVMANHMLYYVADKVRALESMRAVLRPGGRIVLTTNARHNMARLFELHAACARELGFAVRPGDASSFALEDTELVRAVFPNASVVVRRDALLFDDTAPALRFYASGFIDTIRDRPTDGSHRAPLMECMRHRIQNIIEREGLLRVEKDAGCFVADV
jgi:ubiquinone/menaquinone biosynthesis C-methylase UbiE